MKYDFLIVGQGIAGSIIGLQLEKVQPAISNCR